MKIGVTAAAAAFFVVAAAAETRALSVDAIYAFGDSLNDCCINPAAPFTNGPDSWLVEFSALLGAGYVDTAETNYAIGGAQSGDTNAVVSADMPIATGLQAQVARFKDDAPAIGADDLAVIWVGTNDIWTSSYDQDQLFGVPGLDINKPLGNDPSVDALAGYIAGNIQTSVRHLRDGGFQQVLLLTPYDIGDSALFDTPGGPAQNTAYSEALRDRLVTLFTMGIDTYVLDVVELIRELQAGAPGNGFTELGTDPSCTFGMIVCEDRPQQEQDSFIFYDFVHLTTATNARVSRAAAAVIEAGIVVPQVPLPASGLLLLGGIAALAGRRALRAG